MKIPIKNNKTEREFTVIPGNEREVEEIRFGASFLYK